MKCLGYLADEFGWESVFYVFGILSLIWFLAWAFLISDSPDTHPTISREERDYIKRSIGKLSSIKPSLVSYFYDETLFLRVKRNGLLIIGFSQRQRNLVFYLF